MNAGIRPFPPLDPTVERLRPQRVARAGATDGQALVWNEAARAFLPATVGGGAAFDPKMGWLLWADFTGLAYLAEGNLRLSGSGGFSVAGNGLPAGLQTAGTNGVGSLGVTTSGNHFWHTNNNGNAAASIIAAGTYTYEMRVALQYVPDGTDQATIYLGMGNGGGGGVGTFGPHGVYFRASHNDANWQLVAIRSSTETELDTGVALTAHEWVVLRFEFTPGTGVTGYIDGTSIGTITTNLPQVGDALAMFVAAVLISGGSNARGLYCDYLHLTAALSSARAA